MASFWQGKNCLVTGGAGFGGGHLCERLLALGARVFVLDRLVSPWSYFQIQGLDRHAQVWLGDIRDGDFVRLNLSRFAIDTIFHLAAQPIVPTSNVLPWETLSVNAMGTYTLLEAMRNVDTVERMVFASSGAYYGMTTDERALRESDPPLDANNIYASSKVAGDCVARSYARIYDLQIGVCRFMNTYGPGDINFSRLVPRAIYNLLEGQDYDFGARDDGSSRLDFLYIADMADAYLKLGESLGNHGGKAFNFGTGTATSITDVATELSWLYDGERRTPIFRGDPRSKPAIKYLEIERARLDLGWVPETSLADGLRATLDWYADHWEKLRHAS
ncbi:NAD-dependent epimerase/dehydratase family protein [Acidithiobacillus sp. CV18-2]|uniref:NAD-dependent epimerase/dehydratase family protein n=1 Tax=Igneacidithiobacillus copahuensis TaxID=2724909 RepID=A0AAE2YPS9_9PROT|nr:NAD-dependent epimerase/dehydratase family protein [Igneacidithiobacillus copahuensis]MBU2755317.1 NAD-dependent epimerase/dehydratase family protein [Acidithiobacillus sp. CV18-3]MBU2756100.1 NAD-dependent epimerase/dehydratase family protein [Acidithiobacillus sp. BN09-2]MBU2778289.1 NAD-dependent epimerase/dehydratase family protein [Acidithiobacillus sp. CV18-2]MBU2796606.1 NAD-dependent epimerase/dehydratase family protein [Acidithiobacillus sp. VAN18-2]MBU2797991.1 NAD-dependent epime